jgi:hypothetical protein
LLSLYVQRGRQIVENQQFRVAHEHGRSGALHLPAGGAHPARANQRI